jgi:hypothetical protein
MSLELGMLGERARISVPASRTRAVATVHRTRAQPTGRETVESRERALRSNDGFLTRFCVA